MILYDFICYDTLYCAEVCFKKFNDLGLYELEKKYFIDIEPRKNEKFLLMMKNAYIYHLKPGNKPF